MPPPCSHQVAIGARRDAVAVLEFGIELVGGIVVDVIHILHHVEEVAGREHVGVLPRASIAHEWQTHEARIGGQGRIELQTVLRALHEKGRAHGLPLSQGCSENEGKGPNGLEPAEILSVGHHANNWISGANI